METEAVFCLSNPGKSPYCCMFLQGGNKIRSTLFPFFFFNLIKLEKQRLIYEASVLPTVPTMPPSLPTDAQLQNPTADRDTWEMHHTQSCSLGGLKKLQIFNE